MAKKKSKRIIPKRIAGVKVPKSVRRGRFGDLLASRTGQAMIAQAILGAGAVAAGIGAKKDPKARGFAAKGKDKIADTAQDATRQTAQAGSALAYALSEAARSFAEALRRGETRTFSKFEEAEAWTPDYGAPDSTGAKTGSNAPQQATG